MARIRKSISWSDELCAEVIGVISSNPYNIRRGSRKALKVLRDKELISQVEYERQLLLSKNLIIQAFYNPRSNLYRYKKNQRNINASFATVSSNSLILNGKTIFNKKLDELEGSTCKEKFLKAGIVDNSNNNIARLLQRMMLRAANIFKYCKIFNTC